jgi:predicted porin
MESYMQGKMLVAALVAALPLVASAQSSVTIYGVVDASVAHEDTGAPNGSKTGLNSGNQSTSRFGFKGQEDIGNGLKAVFALEAGYNVDTGVGDSALFGRRAVVGLEGSFGGVLLGREYTPVADVANVTDINGQGFYGSNLSSFAAGRLTRRISNSVNYRSAAAMGGFKLGAAYGMGEQSTGPSKDLLGVSLAYQNDSIYVGGAYHTVENLTVGKDKEYIVGAAFKFSDFEIKTNYMVADPTGTNNKYEQVNLGASYAFDANKIYTNFQTNKLENGAKGNLFSVAYSYSLSKRTNVYAAYATMRNNAQGLFAIYSAGSNITPPTTTPGADPTGLTVGLRHTF